MVMVLESKISDCFLQSDCLNILARFLLINETFNDILYC